MLAGPVIVFLLFACSCGTGRRARAPLAGVPGEIRLGRNREKRGADQGRRHRDGL